MRGMEHIFEQFSTNFGPMCHLKMKIEANLRYLSCPWRLKWWIQMQKYQNKLTGDELGAKSNKNIDFAQCRLVQNDIFLPIAVTKH